MSDSEKKPQKTGYKNPPVHTRFQKGKSGNPGGRQRGSRSLKADFLAELAEKVPVTENGKRRKHSKQRITLKALVNKGMSGDVRAAGKVIELWIRLCGLDEASSGTEALSGSDEQILKAFLERYSGQ